MTKQIIISLRMTAVLLLIVCGIYPAMVWAVGQAAFKQQANGSVARDSNGKEVGSMLLAQGFAKPEYFHPRQSAAGNGYDPTSSGGTNYGPTSDKLIHGAKGYDGIQQLSDAYRKENGLAANVQVPVDAVTRSASGLDPDISIANANMQANRVATARQIPAEEVNKLITAHTMGRSMAILGEPRVNVLELNIELDKQHPMQKR